MSLTTMLMNNKTQPGDRGAAIYKALWHAIIEQALWPGAKLPEDAIGGEK
jgi:DNA-binding GntR family transcriptional regulator